MTGATGFSGSSMRDESLYSTATRKQSVDTMTAAGGATTAAVVAHSSSNRSDSGSHSGSGGHTSRISGGTPSVAHPRHSFDHGADVTATVANGYILNAATAAGHCNGHDVAGTGGIGAPDAHCTSVTVVCGHQSVDGGRAPSTADTIHIALLRSAAGAPDAAAAASAHGPSTWLRRLRFWRWRGRQHHVRSKHPMAYYSPPMEQHRLAAMGNAGRKRKMCVEFEETLLEALETVETGAPPQPDVREALRAATASSSQPSDATTDAISGSSLTDADTAVLSDELSAYMAELRMREQS